MLEDVFMCVFLFADGHEIHTCKPIDFGENVRHKPRLLQNAKTDTRLSSEHDLYKLVSDALLTYDLDTFRHRAHCFECRKIDHELELSCKARSAQHAEWVVFECRVWFEW